MINKVAMFKKVSFEQFADDYKKLVVNIQDEKIKEIYDTITVPKRSTAGSAGYDFVSPIDFELNMGQEITIPTGIRAEMSEGWVLMIFPRSGLGFKYGCRLLNTVGVIDFDYYFADNEGHILVKIRNDGYKPMSICAGDKIVQGVFLPFGVTIDDDATEVRNGGFGSTGR